ncbi:MAG: hypothetical protein LBT96_05400 [Campylobacteraceae bacterium]|nr:hypothetical protein [Campylobacteraceae bacterium]
MGVITEIISIDDNIIDVVKTLGGGLNAALLLAETCSVESNYGGNVVGGDVGIMQFTTIGFEDTKQRTNQARKQLIKQKYNIDIDSVKLTDLQFSPLKSIIFARLFYLLRQGAIPSSVSGRAQYWKQYYNTSLGAGTEEQYIKKAKANPRPNIIKAFS